CTPPPHSLSLHLLPPPPTPTPFPYTTLFRSAAPSTLRRSFAGRRPIARHTRSRRRPGRWLEPRGAPNGGAGRAPRGGARPPCDRSEEHTSELQSLTNLVCRLLLEKKKEIVIT